jgi:uncharacterized RDD family membrane protein YckC
MFMEQTYVTYPKFTLRLRAIWIDGIIIALLLFLTALILAKTSIVLTQVSGYLIFAVILSIEPLLIAFTGASIGQRISGICVQRKSDSRPPSIVVSYLRYLIKIPLGSFSIFTIFTTKKYQAIHDLVCSTVVVIKDPKKVKQHHVLSERANKEDLYFYPAMIRRAVIILLYWVLAAILFVILTTVVVYFTCITPETCGVFPEILLMILSLCFWVVILAILIYGWNGFMYGARRIPKNIS